MYGMRYNSLTRGRVGTWSTTTATPSCSELTSYMPAYTVNVALMQLLPPRFLDLSTAMAPIPSVLCVSPLSSSCSQVESEPWLRTSNGKRCRLSCCIELSEGFHVSFGQFYNFNSPSVGLIQSQSSLSIPFLTSGPDYPFKFNMPCLRPRMLSRKGSSRGQVNTPPAFPSSATSSDSSDTEVGRAAAPSRSRGRGRGRRPSTSAAHVRLTSSEHFHSARFNYPCSFNHHDFIASVSIKFRINPPAQAPPSAPSGTVQESEDGILFCPPGVSLQSFQGISASQPELPQARPCAPSGQAPSPPADAAFSSYACPVVEEAPSPTNDA